MSKRWETGPIPPGTKVRIPDDRFYFIDAQGVHLVKTIGPFVMGKVTISHPVGGK